MEAVEKRSGSNALSGWVDGYRTFILALIPISALVFLLRLPFWVGVDLYIQQYFGLVFGLMIAAAFLLFPWKKGFSIVLPCY